MVGLLVASCSNNGKLGMLMSYNYNLIKVEDKALYIKLIIYRNCLGEMAND